jgi:hypothetical protein
MSRPVSDLARLLEGLRSADAGDGDASDSLDALVFRKNRESAFRFLSTPFAERAVFVPQCLRSTAGCQAEERGNEYICKRCGACKIADISRRAEELGYMAVKILKGGSALQRFVIETRPKAVLGVSCSMEGVMGILACERVGVPAFCVPLARAGCSDTDVDISDVIAALEAFLP